LVSAFLGRVRDPRAIGKVGVTLACFACLGAVFCGFAGATKTHLFLESFGSAAQPSLMKARGMAVDQETHELYVIDAEAQTISRYHPDGTPSDFSALGTNVIGGFDFGENAVPTEGQVAIDESGTATDGDIYVTQPETHQVEIFSQAGDKLGSLTGNATGSFEEVGGTSSLAPCGVAVDPAGDVFVSTGGSASGLLYEYKPSSGVAANADAGAPVATEVQNPCNLAVGSEGGAGLVFASFVGGGSEGAAAIDPATGSATVFAEGQQVTSLAVDPAGGHVYLGSGEGGGRAITEWSFAGGAATEVGELIQSEMEQHLLALTAGGIAVDGGTHKLYLSGGSEPGGSDREVAVFGPLVTVPGVQSAGAIITSGTTATLNGSVYPDGIELSECFFEYGTSEGYGQTAPCEPGVSGIGGGTEAVAVHADVEGLTAETGYYFRLVAANAESGRQMFSSGEFFTTAGRPAIEAEYSVSVGLDAATVAASINPESSPATYRVEWGPAGAFTEQTATETVGADATAHTVEATLEGLVPGTAYSYRFFAVNAIGERIGGDREFVTFRAPSVDASCPNQPYRTGAAATLPDCRAYEMVSHAATEGADVLPVREISSNPAALDQAAAAGGGLTWSSYHAADGAVSAPYVSQYMAKRGGAGWEDASISPPQGTAINPISFFDDPYRAFSADLCQGWLLYPPGTRSLAAGAIEGFANLYRRTNCGGTAYEALTVPEAGIAPEESSENFQPDLEGVAEDGELAVFQVQDKLTADAAAGRYQAYAYSGGALRDVCVLPDGTGLDGECAVGTPNSINQYVRYQSVGNAVSASGNRVYWSGAEGEVPVAGGATIYLRVNPGEPQSAVVGGECTQPSMACTLPVSGLVSSAPARFFGASKDGSEALFETVEGEQPGNAYIYDAETEEAKFVAGGVLGVLGRAQDMSRIYLASTEKLAGDATEGAPNLYLYEPASGEFRFIAQLSEADVSHPRERLTPTEYLPFLHAAQASPDGEQLAFDSTATPTGYDNTDQATGEADGEVYLYDAEADEGNGRLVCVSCNPTGARPSGGLVEIRGRKEQRLAAYLAPAETQLYEPRDLTDGGRRLFFTSFEALVPGDDDGAQDVYQWESPGTGTCTLQASDYIAASAGCIDPISSGGPIGGGASFVDASEDGDEVFFTTGQSLVGEDSGLIDLYDASVEGGFAEAEVAPECEGANCQVTAPPPASPSPGSSVARPSTNVKVGRHCGKGRHQVRRKGVVRCVKKKAARHRHGRKHRGSGKQKHHTGKHVSKRGNGR
jgi:hypothetical protein